MCENFLGESRRTMRFNADLGFVRHLFILTDLTSSVTEPLSVGCCMQAPAHVMPSVLDNSQIMAIFDVGNIGGNNIGEVMFYDVLGVILCQLIR